jgi:integral membrane protein (TIGR01906 family)
MASNPAPRFTRPHWLPAPPSPRAQEWLWRLTVLAFALSALLLPIAWTVRYTAQNESWWERGFDRFNVERRTGFDRAELDRAGAELRAYFLNDAARADIAVTNQAGQSEALYTEREVVHLIDVKRLLQSTYDAGWAAIGFLIAFLIGVILWQRRNGVAAVLDKFASAGFYAGVGVTAGIAVLGVVAITGFDDAFRQFHLLFFTNDLWQLSNRDRLIQMFPQRFFFETTMLIAGTTIGLAVVLATSGYWYRRRYGHAIPAPAPAAISSHPSSSQEVPRSSRES